MKQYKIRTGLGYARTLGVVRRALSTAASALASVTEFEGFASPTARLVALALALEVGDVELAARLGEEPFDPHRVASAAGFLVESVNRAISHAAADSDAECVRKREEARAVRLAVALRDDPHGSRFDALDARQETASGLRVRSAS